MYFHHMLFFLNNFENKKTILKITVIYYINNIDIITCSPKFNNEYYVNSVFKYLYLHVIYV